MFENDFCSKCVHCATYRDMGASFDVCTLEHDLARADRAVRENVGLCPFRVTKEGLAKFIEKELIYED